MALENTRVKGLYVNVRYADKDITAQISPWLEMLEYTDNLDGEQPDTLTVTLEDSQGLFSGPLYPIKGSALYFEFGYDTGNVFKSGKGFLIDSVKIEGAGVSGANVSSNRIAGSVVLTASANLPAHGIHSRTTKAWTNTTLEAIARDISQKHGLDLVFECKKTISMTRLDQFNKSDLRQIAELTKKYGLFFSIKAGKDKSTLVVADLDTLRSKPPTLKLPLNQCVGYTFSDSVAPNPKGRYVRYFDPIKKEFVEFDYARQTTSVKDKLADKTVDTLDGRGQQDTAVERELLEVYANKEDANDSEQKASVTLPGKPSLLSGVVVELPQDEWGYNAGYWIVTRSKHTMKVDAGYTTVLDLKKYDVKNQ